MNQDRTTARLLALAKNCAAAAKSALSVGNADVVRMNVDTALRALASLIEIDATTAGDLKAQLAAVDVDVDTLVALGWVYEDGNDHTEACGWRAPDGRLFDLAESQPDIIIPHAIRIAAAQLNAFTRAMTPEEVFVVEHEARHGKGPWEKTVINVCVTEVDAEKIVRAARAKIDDPARHVITIERHEIRKVKA